MVVMANKIRLLLVIFLVLFLAGCFHISNMKYKKKSQKMERYYDCISSKKTDSLKVSMKYQSVFYNFKDTLDAWVSKKDNFPFAAYPNYYKYKVDSCVFISSDSLNAILFITLVNKEYRGKGNGGQVKPIVAYYKGNNQWDYIEPPLTMAFGMSESRERMFNSKELAKFGIVTFMREGLVYSRKPCEQSDKFINEYVRRYVK